MGCIVVWGIRVLAAVLVDAELQVGFSVEVVVKRERRGSDSVFPRFLTHRLFVHGDRVVRREKEFRSF